MTFITNCLLETMQKFLIFHSTLYPRKKQKLHIKRTFCNEPVACRIPFRQWNFIMTKLTHMELLLGTQAIKTPHFGINLKKISFQHKSEIKCYTKSARKSTGCHWKADYCMSAVCSGLAAAADKLRQASDRPLGSGSDQSRLITKVRGFNLNCSSALQLHFVSNPYWPLKIYF